MGGNTQVIASVKAELSPCDPSKPDEGSIQCTVECWSSPTTKADFRFYEQENARLSTELNNIVAAPGAIDVKSLCVLPNKYCWKIFVDLVVMQAAGSVIDMCSLAAYAALCDTKLPILNVVQGESSSPEDYDIELDTDAFAYRVIDISNLPIALTLHSIDDSIVVDALNEEEACSSFSVSLAITKDGSIPYMSTFGLDGVNPSIVQGALLIASKLSPLLFQRIDTAVANSSKVQPRFDSLRGMTAPGLYLGKNNLCGTFSFFTSSNTAPIIDSSNVVKDPKARKNQQNPLLENNTDASDVEMESETDKD